MRRVRNVNVVVMLAIVATLGLATVAAGQAREVIGMPEPPVVGAPAPPGPVWHPEALLYDNGPLLTHPNGCPVSTWIDASRLQTNLTMNTLGFGHQIANSNSVADDFTVAAAAGWHISTITFFGYQTSSTSPSINDVRVRIWNGAPNGGGAIVWGDLTTNRISGAATIGTLQRDSETTNCGNNRPIQVVVATINADFAVGTYWVEWSEGGTGASGPWAPPITILGQTTTGNGLQNLAGTWGPANDGGTSTQQGLPFVIDGAVLPVELQKLTIE